MTPPDFRTPPPIPESFDRLEQDQSAPRSRAARHAQSSRDSHDRLGDPSATTATQRSGRKSQAKSAAQRKREQRQRDWQHLMAPGFSYDEASTSSLVESLHRLIDPDRPGVLCAVLVEIGRRGGLSVKVRPYALAPGKRVKS